MPDDHLLSKTISSSLLVTRRLLRAAIGRLDAAESRRQVQTLGALLDLSTQLAAIRTIDEAAQRLATTLPHVVGCAGASVWIWAPVEKLLLCRGCSGELRDRRVGLTESMAEQLTGAGRAVDAGADQLDTVASEAGFAAALIMPITAQDELFGIVVADTSGLVSHERATIANRLPGVAALAAGAFATAQLVEKIRHQAHHDPLTGLPNLRVLEGSLRRPANPSGTPGVGGVVFVDLDRFKRINDLYGHAVGDQLLVEVGRRLRQVVRKEDQVIRIGGDEFAIHMGQDCTAKDAEVVAARLLRALSTPYVLAGLSEPLEISASIGVALASQGFETVDELLSQSDAAMYRAKAAGGATSRFAEMYRTFPTKLAIRRSE